MKRSLFAILLFSSGILFAQSQPVKIKYIDTTNFDLSVKPQDDFFKYANGSWLQKTAIPASKTSWGTTQILYEQSLNQIRSLLEEAAKKSTESRSNKMLGDFYFSGMDSVSIEKKGYQPIIKDLQRIEKIKTIREFVDEIITGRSKGIYSPVFGFSIGQDEKNTTRNIPYVGQGGITLPEKDYYFKNDDRSKNIRKEYRAFITGLFILIGKDSVTADGYAGTIISIETKLASSHLSRTELRDPLKTYNKFSVDDLSKKTRNIFNWRIILNQLHVTGEDSMIIVNPAFLAYADSMLTATPIDDLKVYLQWYILKNNAQYLSDAFVKINFKFNKVLSGQKENTPRWQRMSNLIDNRLGDLLGQLYVSKYFKPAAKKRMLSLVKNLQTAFEKRIRQLEWMNDSTKTKAIAKLLAIGKKIGYPDKWKTYDGLQISKTDLIENVRNCAKWNFNQDLKKLGKPVDKTEWALTAPTVNAYYSPSFNEVAFPAGILQFPFFNFEADDAINYGAIACIIGHEITHGFDDKGKMFDINGNLNDWWVKEDADKFQSITNQFIEEYNQYIVVDTVHLNGQLTVGENIADFGGIAIAYDAFKQTPQGRSDKKIDGFTPDQRFFLSWAQIWRNKKLPETLIRLNNTDVHAPGEIRCNVVLKNMDAFYKAFNIQPGDKMYKEEKDRIKIW